MAVSTHLSRGFTLVESIVSIVILGLAILLLSTLLYPQIEQSARPYYEVRASALANSLMAEILARNFDEKSDHNGGLYRCGETKTDNSVIACTSQDEFGPDGSEPPSLFNDVDDYIGCWYSTEETKSDCVSDVAGELNDVFGQQISEDYKGFRAEVSVVYDDLDGNAGLFKMITLQVTAGQYGEFRFVAHRGNY